MLKKQSFERAWTTAKSAPKPTFERQANVSVILIRDLRNTGTNITVDLGISSVTIVAHQFTSWSRTIEIDKLDTNAASPFFEPSGVGSGKTEYSAGVSGQFRMGRAGIQWWRDYSRGRNAVSRSTGGRGFAAHQLQC